MNISKEVKVSILAIVAGVLLYSGFNFLRGIDFFSSTNKYVLIYDQVDGLTVSNPVIMNGLSVGRVDGIKIIQDERIRLAVTISVDDDIKLGDSTIAKLISSDLFGEKAIDLHIGNNSKVFASGDTLITQIPKGLMDVVEEKAMPVIKNVDSLVLQLRTMLNDKSITHLQNTLANIDTSTGSLQLLIDQNRQNLLAITGNLRKLTTSLNQTTEDLRPILLNLQSITDTLKKAPLAQTVSDLDTVMVKLNRTLSGLEAGEGSLGKLLKEDSLYNNLNVSVKHLDSLFIDMKQRPKRYVHFSVFGKKEKE